MTAKLPIEALGAIVQIDLDGLADDDAAAVRDAWRDTLPLDSSAPSIAERASREGVRAPLVVAPLAGVDRTAMLADLSQRVTLAALERRRGELWMLHASGVAADDGRVVVLVGPSGRGKTTAARALAAHFGYVSDETIAVDDDGRVWPYRKPLSVIEEPHAPKTQRPPSDLGLLPLPDAALRVAAIVLLDRVEDAPGHAAIETVDLGDALGDLVSQSSYLTAMSTPLQTLAALASATGGIRRVTYREATSLPEAIRALFAEPAGLRAADLASEAVPIPSIAGHAVGEVDRSSPPNPAGPAASRYFRAPYVDALQLDEPDRVAVLQSVQNGTGDLRVLAGVAPAVWRVADAASVSDLTAAAIAAYGRPDGDATAIIQAAVGELVAAGVLTTSDLPTAAPIG